MRTESEDKRQELIEHVSNVDDVLGELFLGIYVLQINFSFIYCSTSMYLYSIE